MNKTKEQETNIKLETKEVISEVAISNKLDMLCDTSDQALPESGSDDLIKTCEN
jgi:hypothetical protein